MPPTPRPAGVGARSGAADRARPASLPVPLTSFIGREREIARVSALLRDNATRLVTLSGPGGVGKTRLALRVAATLQDSFADGVVFVPLAPIADPDLVCPTIAQVLGIRDQGDQPPVELLITALRDFDGLLVLDNLEQVITAAPALAELLAGCPGLKVLVTSRILLRISGEQDVPVRPLELPDPASHPQHFETEAVRLFVERARAVNADFALTPENARAVAAICQRLDGLPLALELVAAKVRTLPPQALLPRLARTLPLLTNGRRDDPQRLRTMRDAISWSYDLLAPADQDLFHRLAVFSGGFTLEAVAAILDDENHDDRMSAALVGVESLVEQSLVHRDLAQHRLSTDQEPRFGMLETVREFGLERLGALEETSAARNRHALYFLLLAEAASPGLSGPRQPASLARLDSETGNLRAALTWLLAQHEKASALRLARAMSRYWYLHGWLSEGRAALESALSLPGEVAPSLHASALASISQLADWQGDYEQAVVVGDASVAIWLTLDDRGSLSEAYLILSAALLQVHVALAKEAANACVALYQDDHDDLRVSEAYELLGIAAYTRGDYDQAAAFMSHGLPLARRAGDPEVLGGVLGDLGHVSMILGRYDQSRRYLREALALFKELGSHYWIAWCISSLAGGVVHTSPERAARLFGAGAGLRGRAGVPLRPFVQTRYEPMLTSLRQAMGETAFARAWAEGQGLTLPEALVEAEIVIHQRHDSSRRGEAAIGAHGLTTRETEILQLVAAGQSNGEISQQLFISVPTVKRHVSTILGKLQVPSRAAAVAFAHNHGLA